MTLQSTYAASPWASERGGIIETLLQRPAWQERAACRGLGVERFLPELGDPLDDAREVCGRCPMRRECLDFAFEGSTHLYGVWARTSERDRRRLRRVGA